MVGGLFGQILAVGVQKEDGDGQKGHHAQQKEDQHQPGAQPGRHRNPFHGRLMGKRR